MKKREFNKIIKSISTGSWLDLEKIASLSDDVKSSLVYHIVRNRCPIVYEIIPAEFDRAWLSSMGYLYVTKGTRYTFLHTSEQRIK